MKQSFCLIERRLNKFLLRVHMFRGASIVQTDIPHSGVKYTLRYGFSLLTIVYCKGGQLYKNNYKKPGACIVVLSNSLGLDPASVSGTNYLYSQIQ